MRPLFNRCLPVILAAFLVLLICAVPAQAQDEDPGPYYDVPALETQKPWVQFLVASALAAAAILPAFKNPHRGHMD